MLSIEKIELLLLIAAVVAMLIRLFRFPYSVGLGFASIVLALLTCATNHQLTNTLICNSLQQPFILEDATLRDWQELR